jgi:hypothetical protein
VSSTPTSWVCVLLDACCSRTIVLYRSRTEFNDYPQQARWKVTRKNALDDILEQTECAVITKGIYIPLGKKPNPGVTLVRRRGRCGGAHAAPCRRAEASLCHRGPRPDQRLKGAAGAALRSAATSRVAHTVCACACACLLARADKERDPAHAGGDVAEHQAGPAGRQQAGQVPGCVTAARCTLLIILKNERILANMDRTCTIHTRPCGCSSHGPREWSESGTGTSAPGAFVKQRARWPRTRSPRAGMASDPSLASQTAADASEASAEDRHKLDLSKNEEVRPVRSGSARRARTVTWCLAAGACRDGGR